MDKAKDHHHQTGDHQTCEVPKHPDPPPVKCETGNGNTDNNSSNGYRGGRYGTISFQANNSLDIFQVLQVQVDIDTVSDEALMNVKDLQFDSDKAWVTGYVPQLIPVNVEGDTIFIHALLKGECFDKCFEVRIYVEYEEAEILIPQEEESNGEQDCDLEPQEIHL
jgi:hypothetical protein